MVVNYKLIYTPYIHQQILENQTSVLRKSGYQISGKVDNKILRQSRKKANIYVHNSR